MPNLVKPVHLTDDDKATLEGILCQSRVEARTYIRAKILLFKAEHRSNEWIADKLDICVTAVRLCIDKYKTGGIEAALQDKKDADEKWKSQMWLLLGSLTRRAKSRRISGIRPNYGIQPTLHVLSIPLRNRKGITVWHL